MKWDQIYTPVELCGKILAHSTSQHPNLIADFAAGTGELLKVAALKWPRAKLVALDIDKDTVRKLRRGQPSWIVSEGDFLGMHRRKRTSALALKQGPIDLILMNPPFSSRGSSRCEVMVGTGSIWCSRAVAFVMSALYYLAPSGELIAIIPAGSLRSQKDHIAWETIRTAFDVKIASSNGHTVFEGCFPRTVIVRITRKILREHAAIINERALVEAPISNFHIVLYRGRLQMHALTNGNPEKDLPLVHSRILQNGKVDFSQFHASNAPFEIRGPVILFPRVGEPSLSKVVLYTGRKRFGLSDCVIALKADINDLKTLHERLLDDWVSLENLYRGTGAKYLTVADISALLCAYGFRARSPEGEFGWQLKRAIERTLPKVDERLLVAWRSDLQLRGLSGEELS
jgi:hypothetical protein